MPITIPKQQFAVSIQKAGTLDANVSITMPTLAVDMALPAAISADVVLPAPTLEVDMALPPALIADLSMPMPGLAVMIRPRVKVRAGHQSRNLLTERRAAAHRLFFRLGREIVAHSARWLLTAQAGTSHRERWTLGEWARAAHRAASPLMLGVTHAAYSRHLVGAQASSGRYGWLIGAEHQVRHALIGVIRAGHRSLWRLRGIEATAAHQMRWSAGLGQFHRCAYGAVARRTAAHLALIDDAKRLAVAHVTLLADVAQARLAHRSESGAAPIVRAGHTVLSTPAARLAVAHRITDVALPQTAAGLTSIYGTTRLAQRAHALTLTDTVPLRCSHRTRHALRSRAMADAACRYDLGGIDVARRGHRLRHAITSATVWPADGRARVTIAGREIACLDGTSVSADWGAGVWVATLALDPNGVASLPGIGAPVSLSLFGTIWALVVSEVSRSQGEAGEALSITATSPLARQASPPAPHSRAWSPVPLSMSAWASVLAGAPVAWYLPDDPVLWPDARGEDAFEAVKALAATPGGVIHSAPNGALAAHSWRGDGRPLVAVAADEVIEQSVRVLKRTPVGAVTVADTAADLIEYDPASQTASVIANRLRTVALDHTAASGTVLTPLGANDETFTETIEIRAGRASVAHPILNLSQIIWRGRPLSGAPIWRAGFPDLAWPDEGYALATVFYTCRRQSWRLSTDQLAVQLLAREDITHERYHDNTGG